MISTLDFRGTTRYKPVVWTHGISQSLAPQPLRPLDGEVSEVAYGLWGMSGWSGSDDQQSLDSLQLAVDSGCNFFDSAWAYGEGKSDSLLGETMAHNSQKRLYAASKIPPANDKWPALPKYKYQNVFSPCAFQIIDEGVLIEGLESGGRDELLQRARNWRCRMALTR